VNLLWPLLDTTWLPSPTHSSLWSLSPHMTHFPV
jgi:hypothetical protein